MAWHYDPKDAKDCLDAGTYDAELTSVEEKTSKAGNPMLAVIWTVPFNGRDFRIRDFVVNPSTLFKLKAIAKAWHLHKEFDDGTFSLDDYIGKLIVLKLDVQTSAGYGDQNQVVGYEESSGQMPPREPAAPVGAIGSDKDIPF